MPCRSVTDFGRVTHLWGRLLAYCGWLFASQWSGALNPFLSAGLVRQLDPSARLIWLPGKAGWVCDVRWAQTATGRGAAPAATVGSPGRAPDFARERNRPWLTTLS
jgi:hypothetical protein